MTKKELQKQINELREEVRLIHQYLDVNEQINTTKGDYWGSYQTKKLVKNEPVKKNK